MVMEDDKDHTTLFLANLPRKAQEIRIEVLWCWIILQQCLAVAAAAAWPCRMQKRLTVWQCLAPPAIALKDKKNDKMDLKWEQYEELADDMDNCIVITCNYMYLLCNSVPVTVESDCLTGSCTIRSSQPVPLTNFNARRLPHHGLRLSKLYPPPLCHKPTHPGTHPEMRQGAMAVTRSPNELPHGTTVLSRTKRDLRTAGPSQGWCCWNMLERVARAFDNFGAYSRSF
jgi:hypothetical protein